MSNKYRKDRRAKRYTPRAIRPPMIIGSALVMGPVVAIVDQLEREGTLTTDGKGTPIIQDGDGEWYEAAGGIEGLIWHFEMMGKRHGMDLPLEGLRELHIACKYLVPIQHSTIQKLRASLPALQRAMAMGDPDDQLDLLQQTRIKAVLMPA